MEGLTFSGQILVFMLYYDLVEELINNVILTALVFSVLRRTQNSY